MPVTYQHAKLDNGLTIIAETDPDAHSASAGFFVRTGARDEATSLMGVSHFLEHMMFKGTDDLSADDINRGFDGLGARNNAYTTGEMTCFHALVLPERLTGGVELLSKMMRPAIRQSDFDTEKQVILEEIAMYADNPFWVLYEQCVERRYAGHGLAHRVLGTPESVAAMERDEMQAYFNNRYAPDNTVLALAGRVDFDEQVAIADRLCGHWTSTGAARDTSRPPTTPEDFTIRDEKVNRGYAIAISDGPPVESDDRYAAAALAFILGGSDNSRLHWALIEDGLAEEAQAAYDGHAGAGDLFVYASGDPDRLEQIIGTLDAQLDALTGSLTGDDLARLQARIATATALSGERPDGRMQRLGRQWVTLGTYTTLEDELEKINGLTLDDLREVAGKYPFSPRVLGRLLPAG